jgi:adenylate cyclase
MGVKYMDEVTQLERWACAKHTTVALIITDIVGSTALNKQLGNKDWYEIHNLHSRRVSELVPRYDCQKIKDTGDGFLIVFRTAIDAFRFSLELYTNTGHPAIHIRVSIHVGSLFIEKDDIRGAMVNFTARVAGWAERPWVVLSDTAKQHVSEELGHKPSEIRFLPREAELKDYGKQQLWIANTPEIREYIKSRNVGHFPLPLAKKLRII